MRKYAEKLIEEYDVRSGSGPDHDRTLDVREETKQKAIIARELDRDEPFVVAVLTRRSGRRRDWNIFMRDWSRNGTREKRFCWFLWNWMKCLTLPTGSLSLREGELVGELDPKHTTPEELGLYMSGAKRGERRRNRMPRIEPESGK